MKGATIAQLRLEEARAVALGRIMLNAYVIRMARERRESEMPAWGRERLARLRRDVVRSLGGAT